MDKKINERAKSVAQRKFFGMVDAYKKGELGDDEVSSSVKDAADDMSMKQVKDFAKTKHKGLPNHVKESQIRQIVREALQNFYDEDLLTWADTRDFKDEIRKLKTKRFDYFTELIEYFLYMEDKGVQLNDRQKAQLQDACDKISQMGEMGQRWAAIGRRILNGEQEDNHVLRQSLQEMKILKAINETVQTHLVDVMGKYLNGDASAEEANKAIMDLANSSVKKKINESKDIYVLYADTLKSGNSDFMADMEEQIEKQNTKRVLDYIPEESIINDSEKTFTIQDIEKKGKDRIALKKDGYIFVRQKNNEHDFLIYKKK